MAGTQPVVAAKVQPPTLPVGAVRRDALGLLDGLFDVPVTLVTGPAGFGKSWLLADWLRRNPQTPRAWVTLDHADVDVMRLWTHIVEAVGRSEVPDVAKHAQALIQEHTDLGWPLIVDALAAGMDSERGHLVLVLDDAHLLQGEEARRSIAQLLREMPSHVHIVFVGRHDPDLPLGRWRVTGALREIRTNDLRCTPRESQELVNGMLGLVLGVDAIETLRTRTMGWIAGMRLAATMAASRQDSAEAAEELASVGEAPGAYDELADYLVDEVIGHLEGDRQFLLDSSILVDLTPDVCSAVTGRDDAELVLEKMVHAGTFTSRLNTPTPSYRYHDLFRGALQGLLRRTMPSREPKLHLAAARALLREGAPVPAVEHAVAAGDLDFAERILVDASADILAARQIDTLVSLFERIDSTGHQMKPSALMTWVAAVLYSTRKGDEIHRLLMQTRSRLESLSAEEEADVARGLSASAEPFHDSLQEFRAAVDSTIAHRHGDLDLADTAYLGLQRPSENGFVEAAAGEALIFQEQYADGLALTERWHQYCLAAQNDTMGAVNLGHCLSIVALGKHGQGHLDEADRVVDRAVVALSQRGLADRPQLAIATLPAGWVAWERGELDAAAAVVESVLGPILRLAELPAELLARMLTARIHSSRGEPKAAYAELDAALVPSGPHAVPPHFANWIRLERARIALLCGDVDQAVMAMPDWERRLAEGTASTREYLVLARMALAAGAPASATELARLPEGAELTPASEIEIHKLAALAALATGDETGALDELTAAFAIASHTGHRQTFLDDSRNFGHLLDNAAARNRVPLRRHEPAASTPRSPVASKLLADPLTPRELEVVRMLPSHLSYRGIAERLYVSPNTVKFYIKTIYRKLDADDRADAVQIARSLGLVGAPGEVWS